MIGTGKLFTKNQEKVYEDLTLLCDLFFDRQYDGIIKPRLDPLIAGPTGAGKSHLIRELSGYADAHYYPTTYGNWMPLGTRSDTGGPTMFNLLDAIFSNHRVLLHLDELDKFREDYSQTWSRSIANDVWNVLDRNFPVNDWITSRNKTELDPERMKSIIQERLWIVGSGTWQIIFEKQTRGQLGFGSTDSWDAPLSLSETRDTIRKAQLIPPELLSRFNVDIHLLNYPSSDEKQKLLEDTGILFLGRSLGKTITPDMLDFQKGGMREIESLMTHLLLERKRQERHAIEQEMHNPQAPNIRRDFEKSNILQPVQEEIESNSNGQSNKFAPGENEMDAVSDELVDEVLGTATEFSAGMKTHKEETRNDQQKNGIRVCETKAENGESGPQNGGHPERDITHPNKRQKHSNGFRADPELTAMFTEEQLEAFYKEMHAYITETLKSSEGEEHS